MDLADSGAGLELTSIASGPKSFRAASNAAGTLLAKYVLLSIY